MDTQQRLTPLCSLAVELRPFGVNLSYSQLSRRAMSAIFPVIRVNNRVYAVGDPAEIARMILNEESKLSSKAA